MRFRINFYRLTVEIMYTMGRRKEGLEEKVFCTVVEL